MPLYLGVEFILGVAILNKASGAYGIVSLFTGHPINFWQWLFNMFALMCLPFYISAIQALTNRLRNTRKMSLVCILYTFDTLVSLLYTFYFIYFWFSNEDTAPTSEPQVEVSHKTSVSAVSAEASQSASPGRELFLTMSGVIIVSATRFYFNLVLVAFTKALLKQDANAPNHNNVIDEEEQVLYQSKSFVNRLRRMAYELEIKSKETLIGYFH